MLVKSIGVVFLASVATAAVSSDQSEFISGLIDGFTTTSVPASVYSVAATNVEVEKAWSLAKNMPIGAAMALATAEPDKSVVHWSEYAFLTKKNSPTPTWFEALPTDVKQWATKSYAPLMSAAEAAQATIEKIMNPNKKNAASQFSGSLVAGAVGVAGVILGAALVL